MIYMVYNPNKDGEISEKSWEEVEAKLTLAGVSIDDLKDSESFTGWWSCCFESKQVLSNNIYQVEIEEITNDPEYDELRKFHFPDA